jgi:lipid-A-disaccharide synthase-like uncharacterized protein
MRFLAALLLLALLGGAVPAADSPLVHGSAWTSADIPLLEQRMHEAARRESFEEAARCRDLIQQIRVEGSTVWYEGRGHMNRVLFAVWGLGITGWKILGYCGILMFGGRWLVQAWYRKRTGRSDMPTAFWMISVAGAGMVTMYFIWGKNDSIGIIGNALPAGVALYNLVQDLRQRRRAARPA